MSSNMLKLSAKKAQVDSVVEEVREQKNGGTLEASRALAEKLNIVKDSVHAEKRVKASAKLKPFVIKIPKEKRSEYQNRPYLHPSYNASEWAGKEPELIALKTLYIDKSGAFQLWNTQVAESLILVWIRSEKLKSFTTDDVEKHFKVFGGGVTDITRLACKKLAKDNVLTIAKAQLGKRKHYVYHVRA